MKEYEIEIPEDIQNLLEHAPAKPGSWIRPEIDAILLRYGRTVQFKDISKAIQAHFGLTVSSQRLTWRYHVLIERKGLDGKVSVEGDLP